MPWRFTENGLHGSGGHRFEGREAVQGQAAQAVHAAADHRVAQALLQQAMGAEQGAGAGGTGGGLAVHRAGQAQPVGEEGGRRGHLLLGVVVVGGQLALLEEARNAVTGLTDARGAGAQHQADAGGAVTSDGGAQLGFDL